MNYGFRNWKHCKFTHWEAYHIWRLSRDFVRL